VGVRLFFEANASTESDERNKILILILQRAVTDRNNGIFVISKGATVRRITSTREK
jgi:hypothetical protein